STERSPPDHVRVDQRSGGNSWFSVQASRAGWLGSVPPLRAELYSIEKRCSAQGTQTKILRIQRRRRSLYAFHAGCCRKSFPRCRGVAGCVPSINWCSTATPISCVPCRLTATSFCASICVIRGVFRYLALTTWRFTMQNEIPIESIPDGTILRTTAFWN